MLYPGLLIAQSCLRIFDNSRLEALPYLKYFYRTPNFRAKDLETEKAELQNIVKTHFLSPITSVINIAFLIIYLRDLIRKLSFICLIL